MDWMDDQTPPLLYALSCIFAAGATTSQGSPPPKPKHLGTPMDLLYEDPK